jgi:hypothetical protein
MQTASFGACVVALVHLSLGSAKARNDAFPFKCNLAGECRCDGNAKVLTPLYVEDVGTRKPIQLHVDRRYLDRWSRNSATVGSAYFRVRADTFEPWPDNLLTTSTTLPHLTILFGFNVHRSLFGKTSAEIFLRGIVYESIFRLDRSIKGPRPFETAQMDFGLNKILMRGTLQSPYLKNDYFFDGHPANNFISCLRKKRHPRGLLRCGHYTDLIGVSAIIRYGSDQLPNWRRIRNAAKGLLACFEYKPEKSN